LVKLLDLAGEVEGLSYVAKTLLKIEQNKTMYKSEVNDTNLVENLKKFVKMINKEEIE